MAIAEAYLVKTVSSTINNYDIHTADQKEAQSRLLVQMRRLYLQARVVGHHDLIPGKACPCFDAQAEYNR